jgi:hypothetical protein
MRRIVARLAYLLARSRRAALEAKLAPAARERVRAVFKKSRNQGSEHETRFGLLATVGVREIRNRRPAPMRSADSSSLFRSSDEGLSQLLWQRPRPSLCIIELTF